MVGFVHLSVLLNFIVIVVLVILYLHHLYGQALHVVWNVFQMELILGMNIMVGVVVPEHHINMVLLDMGKQQNVVGHGIQVVKKVRVSLVLLLINKDY